MFPKGYQRPKTNEQLAKEFCEKFGITPEAVFAESARAKSQSEQERLRDQIIQERIHWFRSSMGKRKEFERLAEGKKTREGIETSLHKLAVPERNTAEALAVTLVEDQASRAIVEKALGQEAGGDQGGRGESEVGERIRAFQSDAIELARTFGWIRNQLENELKMKDYKK